MVGQSTKIIQAPKANAIGKQKKNQKRDKLKVAAGSKKCCKPHPSCIYTTAAAAYNDTLYSRDINILYKDEI
jgi:hypothetical protein